MMKIENEIRRATKFWNNGNALEAGRIIFEMIPSNAQPLWASTILKLVIDKSDMSCAPIQKIADIAANYPQKWRKAHRIFTVLRKMTLHLESKRRKKITKEEELFYWQLSLAELVAKVTYNATSPLYEFDEDSGWWIAVMVKGFTDCLGNESFSRDAWRVLSTLPQNSK